MSFSFYAYENIFLSFVIGASIAFNFCVGTVLSKRKERKILYGAVFLNLAYLGVFKYTLFFSDIVRGVFGIPLQVASIVLPPGISFFTFQQIAFLMDVWRRRIENVRPLNYILFVSFFPQLIAGPIVHYLETVPQFATLRQRQRPWPCIAAGLTLFAIGLAKKRLLADNLAVQSDSVFAAAAAGAPLDFLTAWSGTLAYTCQIYFDFSAYSDMAIGLGLMFGIRFPVNFNSPYRAASLREFWRRWHITLSRFLRDYLYIPLGGNRGGYLGHSANIIVTMALGGLWHGAGFNFVLWGVAHGILLALTHALRRHEGWRSRPEWLARGSTFLIVALLWVLFRSQSLDAAANMYLAMLSWRGAIPPGALAAGDVGTFMSTFSPWRLMTDVQFPGLWKVGLLTTALLIVWLMPNSQQILGRRFFLQTQEDTFQEAALPLFGKWVCYCPNGVWGSAAALMAASAIFLSPSPAPFIYFQF